MVSYSIDDICHLVDLARAAEVIEAHKVKGAEICRVHGGPLPCGRICIVNC